MNRINAEDCRRLVEESKIDTIYHKIADKARIGHESIQVPFISEDCFRCLIEDGFRIFAMDGECELTQYDKETVDQSKEFEIAWEAE